MANARGGAICAEARLCDDISCNLYRWKKTADAKRETTCLCGRPFVRTEWRPVRSASARAARAKAKAQPKAKAKAKPQAKAKAQAVDNGSGTHQPKRPWSKPQGGTTSPTDGQSAVYKLPQDVAARAATDDVALAEEQLRWFKAVGREDHVKQAQQALTEAHRKREEALPPEIG